MQKLNGCHNRTLKDHYFAPNRIYNNDGTYANEQKQIDFTMTRTCNYDCQKTDKGCEGCKHVN